LIARCIDLSSLILPIQSGMIDSAENLQLTQTRIAPKGAAGWLWRKILPAGAMLATLGGLVVLVLWIVGRVLTDRFGWSQWVWWVVGICGSVFGVLGGIDWDMVGGCDNLGGVTCEDVGLFQL
jgi:hypothetical protein